MSLQTISVDYQRLSNYPRLFKQKCLDFFKTRQSNVRPRVRVKFFRFYGINRIQVPNTCKKHQYRRRYFIKSTIRALDIKDIFHGTLN